MHATFAELISPSLISRTVSVDVKHHVYLLTAELTDDTLVSVTTNKRARRQNA